MLIARIWMPWDEDPESCGFLFETEQDAYDYFYLKYKSYFDSRESLERRIDIEKVKPLPKPFWNKMTPYFARFEDGVMIDFDEFMDDSMLLQKLQIQTGHIRYNKSEYVHVKFWASEDVEQAKVIAEGYYKGWKQAQP